MPRLLGIDIPNDKQVRIALTYIHGIGQRVSDRLLDSVGITPSVKARDLSDEELARISDYIDKHLVVEGQLRRQTAANVQRLKEIGCYRGLRHRKGLPVRGQRTRSNARGRKGPRKTVAGKKGAKG
jgi:small subunit ribosomal protein S13